jgi:hypothetical protein
MTWMLVLFITIQPGVTLKSTASFKDEIGCNLVLEWIKSSPKLEGVGELKSVSCERAG